MNRFLEALRAAGVPDVVLSRIPEDRASSSSGTLAWLLESQLVDDRLLADVAAETSRHTRVDPPQASSIPDPVVSMIAGNVARTSLVAPVSDDGTYLDVLVVNPFDRSLVNAVGGSSGRRVRVQVCARGQLQELIAELYRSDSEQMLDSLGEDLRAQREIQSSGEDSDDPAADSSPAARLVVGILQRAVDEGASDVHIQPSPTGVHIRHRVDGVLREVSTYDANVHQSLINRLKILAQLDIATRHKPQDGRIGLKLNGGTTDIRLAILPSVRGESAVMRILNQSGGPLDISKQEFAPAALEAFKQGYHASYGLVLVTGPTGSGKSTTLHSALTDINKPEVNIITVEDPVEFRYPGVTQIQVNEKQGLTFAGALRSILRADPDILLVGELRDGETASIAMDASLTGHLVLSTLHTNDAASAVGRLTKMGIEPFLLASALRVVVGQRLVRRLCTQCRRPAEMSAGQLRRLGFSIPEAAPDEAVVHVHEAVGCPRCNETGYQGRLAIREVLVVDDVMRRMIADGRTGAELAERAIAAGMETIRTDGLRKVAEGKTSVAEILRVSA